MFDPDSGEYVRPTTAFATRVKAILAIKDPGEKAGRKLAEGRVPGDRIPVGDSFAICFTNCAYHLAEIAESARGRSTWPCAGVMGGAGSSDLFRAMAGRRLEQGCQV